MQLNADLGESFGSWKMGNDAEIMPFIGLANVACGYHAGDPLVMQSVIGLAKQHQVDIGAHVSYPDLAGFGRRSMQIPKRELIAIIHAQIAVLEGMAKCQNVSLSHVKPHGALYNDMMKDMQLFESIVEALSTYHYSYPLMIQALANNDAHQTFAKQHKVALIYEAFADRAYTDEGFLQPRNQANAVLNASQALEQAVKLIKHGKVKTVNGTMLKLKASTLCVHSDNEASLQLCRDIYAELAKQS